MQVWLVALLFLLVFQPVAQATSPAPIDIVFDIDWTTFYSINLEESNQKNTEILFVEGKNYRATDYLADVIETLVIKYPEIRISFFSGGEKSRNETLLSSIMLSDGRSIKDVTHRLLSKTDLTVVSQNESLPFATRNKKVLDKGIPDWSPERTILIDDQVAFAKPPLKAVHSLGVFNFQNRFDQNKVLEKHYPMTENQWRMERNKALLWLAMIDLAMNESKSSGEAFSSVAERVWQKQSENSFLVKRGQQLIERFEARSCHKIFAF